MKRNKKDKHHLLVSPYFDTPHPCITCSPLCPLFGWEAESSGAQPHHGAAPYIKGRVWVLVIRALLGALKVLLGLKGRCLFCDTAVNSLGAVAGVGQSAVWVLASGCLLAVLAWRSWSRCRAGLWSRSYVLGVERRLCLWLARHCSWLCYHHDAVKIIMVLLNLLRCFLCLCVVRNGLRPLLFVLI